MVEVAESIERLCYDISDLRCRRQAMVIEGFGDERLHESAFEGKQLPGRRTVRCEKVIARIEHLMGFELGLGLFHDLFKTGGISSSLVLIPEVTVGAEYVDYGHVGCEWIEQDVDSQHSLYRQVDDAHEAQHVNQSLSPRHRASHSNCTRSTHC